MSMSREIGPMSNDCRSKEQDVNLTQPSELGHHTAMAAQAIDVTILKDHLDKTAHMCTNLLKTLDHQVGEFMHQSKMEEDKKDTELESEQKDEICQSTDPEVLREENIFLKDALGKLEDKLQKVIQINHRWQTYNQQRDEYIQFLHNTMQETRDNHLYSSVSQPPVESEHQVKSDVIVLQWKTRVEEVLQEQRKIEDEVTKLTLENGQLTQNNTEQEQIARLLQEELNQLTTVCRDQHEDKEKLVMMQQQVQIYEQDFQQERTDRERAQTKIQQLEQELQAAKAQLDVFYEQNRRECYRVQAQHNRGCEHHGVGLYQCDGEDTDEEDKDEADCQLSAAEAIPACSAKEPTLSCPRCKTEFTVENHKHLLEHMETCNE